MGILSFLNPIGGITGLAKIALITGALAGIITVGTRTYNYVRTAEQSKITVQLQQQQLQQDQQTIASLQADKELINTTIKNQLEEIADLNEHLSGINLNLSDDANLPAANSLRQVIDRLRAINTGE